MYQEVQFQREQRIKTTEKKINPNKTLAVVFYSLS